MCCVINIHYVQYIEKCIAGKECTFKLLSKYDFTSGKNIIFCCDLAVTQLKYTLKQD